MQLIHVYILGVYIVVVEFISTTIGSVENCGGYIAAGKLGNSGYLCSPGFPTSYPNNTHCIWLVKTDADRAVHLALHHLQAEISGTECTDFLEIRAGSRTSELLYLDCELNGDVTLESPSRWLWIRFYSGDEVDGAGFSATWTVIDDTGEVNTTDPTPSCPATKYSCTNKECIYMSWVCDGVNDCGCIENCDENHCHNRFYTQKQRMALGIGCGTLMFAVTVGLVAMLDRVYPKRRFINKEYGAER